MDHIRRIQLEVRILPGTSEEQAAVDMASLATRLGVSVGGSFNGCEMWAHPNDTVLSVLSCYEKNKRLRGEK